MAILRERVAGTYIGAGLLQFYDFNTGVQLHETYQDNFISPDFIIQRTEAQRRVGIRLLAGDASLEIGTITFDFNAVSPDGSLGAWTDPIFDPTPGRPWIFATAESGKVFQVRQPTSGRPTTNIVNNTSLTFVSDSLTGNTVTISPNSTAKPILSLYNGLHNDLAAAEGEGLDFLTYSVNQDGYLIFTREGVQQPDFTITALLGTNTIIINPTTPSTGSFPVLIDNISSKNVALVDSSTTPASDIARLAPRNAATIYLSAGTYLIGNEKKSQDKYASFTVGDDGTVTKVSGSKGDITIKVDGTKVIVKDRKKKCCC